MPDLKQKFNLNGLSRVLLASFSIKLFVLILFNYLLTQNLSWLAHIQVDIWGWLEFLKKSKEGLIPYVDFTKEYPVGAGLFFWFFAKLLPAPVDAYLFLKLHAVFMSAVDVASTLLFFQIIKTINEKRAVIYSLIFICLPTALILSPVRFETLVIFSILLGYYYHRKNNPLLATLIWSLGFSLKWFPIIFIAAQEWQALWSGRSRQWWKSALIFLSVTCFVNMPFVILGILKHGDFNQWLATYQFHVNRPLYIDTVLGVMQLWWGTFRFEQYGSKWSAALMLAVLLWRPLMKFEAKVILIFIAALVFNRVYSTQFNLYFYPMMLVLCAGLEEMKKARHLLMVLFVLDFINIGVYPFSFAWALTEMGNFDPYAAALRGGVGAVLFSVLIGARAVVLVYLAKKL